MASLIHRPPAQAQNPSPPWVAHCRPQAPYMKQLVNDFAAKNNFSAVHLLLADGQPVVSYGPVPEGAALGAWFKNGRPKAASRKCCRCVPPMGKWRSISSGRSAGRDEKPGEWRAVG